MSKGAAIARIVCKAFPPTFKRRNTMIYNAGFCCYLTGVMIERSACKDTFFARRLVVPFVRQIGFVHLSYIDRIMHCGECKTEFFQGTPAEIAATLLESIREQDLVHSCEQPYSPRQFLERFSIADNTALPINRMYDIAAAAALAGEFGAAGDCFRTIQAALARAIDIEGRLSETSDALFNEVNESLAALAVSGPALQDHLHRCCRRNAQSLGFESALWDR